MRNEPWVVIDTETNGLSSPIYVVEIAAQRMRGWKREGDGFRVLLNHNVRIDPAAQAVHGYSREFLSTNGISPRDAHNDFWAYTGTSPIVAYNLAFDWDRCLVPECSRMGLPVPGTKGFCAMTLARRTIAETENYRLETLKNHFQLNSGQSHRGRNDVDTLCGLFEKVFEPRLSRAGILGFEAIRSFCRLTPVAKCLDQVTRGAAESQMPPVRYLPSKPRARHRPMDEFTAHRKWIDEIFALCRDILADGIVTDLEIHKLQEWLTACPCTHVAPISVIADRVEQILCDGVITDDEKTEMKSFLDEIINLLG